MSGWIKIERALVTDLRFKRVVRKVAGITNIGNALPPVEVSKVLGALTQLWLHADEHIGEDDIIRGSVDDINELVGIDGFAQALPADWLVVVDPEHVQLPDFVDHNGTSARERKLNAERQARFKAKHRTTPSNGGVTGGNAANAAKQTNKPKETNQTHSEPSAPEVPESPPAILNADIHEFVGQLKDAYPKTGRQNWISAEHHLRLVMARGHSASDILAGVIRYASFCAATARQSENPANFFAAVDEPWTQPWLMPGKAQANGKHDAAWAEARARAKAIGFREAHPAETPISYQGAMDSHESQQRRTPITGVTALTDRLKGTAK